MLHVGVDESPAPPLYFGTPGTPECQGFEIDLLTSIADYLRLQLRCEAVGWEAALERLLDGRLDMLCRAVSITPERRRVVSFSDPYLETALVLVLRRNSPVQDVADLIGLDVGVRRATSAEEYLRRNCPAATVSTFDDHAESYTALENGTVAAVVDHETIAAHYVRSAHGLKASPALQGTLRRYGMVFAPANDGLRKGVNEALAALRSEGIWERHHRRWINTS